MFFLSILSNKHMHLKAQKNWYWLMIIKNRSNLFQPKTIIAFLDIFMVFVYKGFIYAQRKLWLKKQDKKVPQTSVRPWTKILLFVLMLSSNTETHFPKDFKCWYRCMNNVLLFKHKRFKKCTILIIIWTDWKGISKLCGCNKYTNK